MSDQPTGTSQCAWCWLPSEIVLMVEALGFFRHRMFFPGPLRLCMKHATELERDLRIAEAHRV